MTPSSLLFFTTTTMGTLMALSSNNWLFLWMGMELNLLSFIPLIASTQSFQETEASVKYFIIQAIGSGLMLMAGVMSMLNSLGPSTKYITSFMFLLSMVMKLGMAPCHQWLPHIMSSMTWSMCLILSTWQKISPLMMLNTAVPFNIPTYLMLVATTSAIIGGIGGMNQSQFRPLLAYSSIGHMGWMLMAMQFSSAIFSLYFMTYLVITSSLMFMMFKMSAINSNFNTTLVHMSHFSFAMMMFMMFSLGGLPPFLGFIPKWMIINVMATKEMFLMLMLLITGSLLNLFYYFSMMFNFIMMKTPCRSVSISTTNLMLTFLSTLTPMMLYL
uniref:NADH-ubiquinone oxidoreductase chain 2 n=1 Tax=Platynereis massiliensis TaxID=1623346 RepID=A0A7G8JTP2_9ANNE|nr:NADH dehydrogenase subunit 2 [Platynereis massiliensis]QNJ33940.1 NADH dehydrogenase subunit 2 [Platynereis massiliensis]